jgi:hypothetical protein
MKSVAEMIGRDFRLELMAIMSASDETLAYTMHQSDSPGLRKFADQLMDNSNQIKRWMKENLTGMERDLYLSKAEGVYKPLERS